MTADEIARQIERDRQKREDELLLLLLLLMVRIERDITAFIRSGQDFAPVIRNGLLGRGAANLAGPAGVGGSPSNAPGGAVLLIARSMADAHRDAFRRLGRLTGESGLTRDAAGPMDELVRQYTPQARQAVEAMGQTIYDAVAKRMTETPGRSIRRIVGEAFDDAGYSKDKPNGLDVGTERAIVTASNTGMIDAAGSTDAITALRHISVLDDGTTDICRQRHRLTLPIDHPYWQFNVPALHFRCRSVIVPALGRAEYSDKLPTIPPAPGFGAAPVGFVQKFRRRQFV